MDEISGPPVGDPDEEDGAGTSSVSPADVHTLGCTLLAYAQSKRLPENFLRELGLSESRYKRAPAVRIPYRHANGSEAAVRFRTALHKSEHGDNRFCWKGGSKVLLYGLWHLRSEESVVLGEGESDCHTLWYH